MFGGIWNAHGQLFVTLESMGVEPKVHDAVFAAYHRERKKLATPEEMADFLEGHGVDKQAFLKAYNSFGVRGRVEQAKKLGMAYQITGVPVMIVNGKYRFDLGSSGGPERTLQVADFLIEKNAQRGNPACWSAHALPAPARHGSIRTAASTGLPADGRLRLLSFNIQVGISTERYHHYLTRSWQHLLPHPGRAGNLQRIGEVLGNYDRWRCRRPTAAACGPAMSIRSSIWPTWVRFPTGISSSIATSDASPSTATGCLAAWSPRAWRTTRYLGRRDAARSCCVWRGRGRAGGGDDAPGTRRRRPARQLAYIRDLIGDYRHQVLMGDMNTHANDLLENSPLRDLGLLAPQVEATFPAGGRSAARPYSAQPEPYA